MDTLTLVVSFLRAIATALNSPAFGNRSAQLADMASLAALLAELGAEGMKALQGLTAQIRIAVEARQVLDWTPIDQAHAIARKVIEDYLANQIPPIPGASVKVALVTADAPPAPAAVTVFPVPAHADAG